MIIRGEEFGLIEIERQVIKRNSTLIVLNPKAFGAYNVGKVISTHPLKDKFILYPAGADSQLKCPDKSHWVLRERDISAIVEAEENETFVPEVDVRPKKDGDEWYGKERC